jgi:hypothetical protein
MGVRWGDVPRATGPERFMAIERRWRGMLGSRQAVVSRVTVEAEEEEERRATRVAMDVVFMAAICGRVTESVKVYLRRWIGEFVGERRIREMV